MQLETNIRVKPVILCGGSGTRLWPLSTPVRPKQFRPLTGREPMLTETANRVSQGPSTSQDNLAFSPPLIVGSTHHHELINECLPGVDRILEPVGRNSAPAIAAAALLSAPDDLLLVLPADHHIGDIPAFHQAIYSGAEAAMAGQILTFGIEPDHPATGYGYIQSQAGQDPVRVVRRFVEKPDLDTARQYLKSGDYFWNAGIFLFQAKTMIKALELHSADILESASQALPRSATLSAHELDYEQFSSCRSISIDYAVMEPVSEIGGISVVPVDMGWSDIGDHAALRQSQNDADAHSGAVFSLDTTNCFLKSEGPFLGAIGVKNLAIITRPDATLVVDLSRSQDVKKAAEMAAHFGTGFMLKDALRDQIRTWLFDEVLPYWAEHGWDQKNGGFKEGLNLDDRVSESQSIRRVRVQARQIYSFAHAKALGWEGPADTLIQNGLSYMDQHCWRDNRGIAHLITPSGDIHDDRMDTYDQAFMLTALAWAHRAEAANGLREKVSTLINTIDTHLALSDGSFKDDDQDTPVRRANPHMHMLEAYLALYEAFAEPEFLSRAGRMVELFELRFFDPVHDRIIEHFTPDWNIDPDQGHRTEPGHAYEWATLLAKYERYTGRDLASWRRRLMASTDRHGRNSEGFAVNEIDASGLDLDMGRRLWPQTEMLRARLVEPGSAPAGETERLIKTLMASYFKDAGPGLWMDAYDGDGQPSATHIPASSLYHVMSAFAPVLDGRTA